MPIIRRMMRHAWVHRTPAERALKKRTRPSDTMRVTQATLGYPGDARFDTLVERLLPGTPVAKVADHLLHDGYHTNMTVALTTFGAEWFSIELRHIGEGVYLLCVDIKSPEYTEDVDAHVRRGIRDGVAVNRNAYTQTAPVPFDTYV